MSNGSADADGDLDAGALERPSGLGCHQRTIHDNRGAAPARNDRPASTPPFADGPRRTPSTHLLQPPSHGLTRDPVERYPVRHLLRPPPDETGTAAIPRAEIGLESRLVISAEPTSLLRNEEPIELPAARSVTMPLTLPAEFRTKPEVLLEGVLSAAPDPDESLDTARGKVKVGPVLIATRGHEDAEIHFEIPPEMAGRPGRLTVLARAVSAGTDLYDETLLVPLMIRGPGIAPGVEVEPQVGLVDLTPTILDLAQVRTPIAMQGRSFARLLTGRGTAFEERPVVSEVLHGLDGGTAGAAAPVRSVRTRTAKYMRTLGGERLYDLTTDPAESRNRMADQPSVAAEARRVLDEQAAACARSGAEAQPEEWDPRGLPAWLTDGRLNALDRLGQAKRKLESLGYVD